MRSSPRLIQTRLHVGGSWRISDTRLHSRSEITSAPSNHTFDLITLADALKRERQREERKSEREKEGGSFRVPIRLAPTPPPRPSTHQGMRIRREVVHPRPPLFTLGNSQRRMSSRDLARYPRRRTIGRSLRSVGSASARGLASLSLVKSTLVPPLPLLPTPLSVHLAPSMMCTVGRNSGGTSEVVVAASRRFIERAPPRSVEVEECTRRSPTRPYTSVAVHARAICGYTARRSGVIRASKCAVSRADIARAISRHHREKFAG